MALRALRQSVWGTCQWKSTGVGCQGLLRAGSVVPMAVSWNGLSGCDAEDDVDDALAVLVGEARAGG